MAATSVSEGRVSLALSNLCLLYLRPILGWTRNADGTLTAVFNPPLTTAEQATLADLETMVRFGLATDLTLAEFQAMKADLALGKAFLGIASPTTAQAVAAEKAIIRILGALLRS